MPQLTFDAAKQHIYTLSRPLKVDQCLCRPTATKPNLTEFFIAKKQIMVKIGFDPHLNIKY